MGLRRRKSRKQQAADLVGTYLKVKTASKAAKGAKKAAKGTAVAAKRSPVRKVGLIVAGAIGAVGAAFVAFKATHRGDREVPAGA